MGNKIYRIQIGRYVIDKIILNVEGLINRSLKFDKDAYIFEPNCES